MHRVDLQLESSICVLHWSTRDLGLHLHTVPVCFICLYLFCDPKSILLWPIFTFLWLKTGDYDISMAKFLIILWFICFLRKSEVCVRQPSRWFVSGSSIDFLYGSLWLVLQSFNGNRKLWLFSYSIFYGWAPLDQTEGQSSPAPSSSQRPTKWFREHNRQQKTCRIL